MKNNNNRFKIFSAVIYVIAMILLAFITVPLLKTYKNPEEFTSYINNLGILGFILMLFVQIAQIIVALIPGEIIEFISGTLYGWLGGFIFCMAGIAIGQTIIFVAVRYFGSSLVEKAAGSKTMNRFRFLNNDKKLKTILFILFFFPGTPKDLLTYIVPLTKISLRDFLIITLFARIPSVISSTVAGGAFGKNDIKTTVIIYAAVALISLICSLFYKAWEKHPDNNSDSTKQDG